MSPPTIRAAVFLLLTLACAGHLGAAREAYDHGSYAQAARLAELRLQDHPDDAEARELRQQARGKALEKLLADEQAARARGDRDGALAAMGQLLERRRTWELRLPGGREAALAGELEEVRGILRDEVAPLLGRGRALAAESRLDARRALLEDLELAALGAELHAQVHQTGTRRCGELRKGAAADEPYWTHLVGRYCRHFGSPAATAPLPGLFGGLSFAGAVEGLPAGELSELQHRLDSALQQTPWYQSGAPTAGSRLGGRHQVTFTPRSSSRTRTWSVQVPYSDTETYYESHQVPYQASETYYESVPQTTYESYTYTCGYGTNYRTCTGTRPVTHYRQESRTRYVTKYRSESQMKTRSVTKYRSEQRSQVYYVTECLGAYATNLSVAVNLGAGGPAVARADATSQLTHESDCALAGRGQTTLLTPTQWLAPRATALEGGLVWELRKAWYDSACRDGAPSREQAARCLHGTADPPAPVRAVVAAQLGEDAPRLLELSAGPRQTGGK